MLDIRSKKFVGTLTLAAVVAVIFVMAPYTLVDPINLPKMLVLAFFSIIEILFLAPFARNLIKGDYRSLVIISSLFVVQIIFVLFFSHTNFNGQFYGIFGRNTGALTYISLAILLVGSSLIADREFLKKFVIVMLGVGVILIIYGNIQYLGLEPFPFVNAYTANAPIGTFGNPDFQSAFMGLIAISAFTMALNAGLRTAFRFGFAFMGVASVIVIYETIAKQGYFALLAGAFVVLILWLFMNKRKTLGIAFAGIGALGGGLVFLALINAGPLASFIYKGSLAARGFYWRAAIKMLINHPFFGVGMDGFFDWYRRSRPADYSQKNFFSISNTAHNVYLDIASSGGFPLILIYGALMGLVILSIIRFVKRSQGFDVYFTVIADAWAAYQTQYFISINQIGLAIMGWVLSGLIIGYEINTRVQESVRIPATNSKQGRKRTKVSPQPLSSATIMRVFAGVVLGALIVIPPYYANTSFFSSLKSNDIKAIQTAAYLKPIDERRLLHLSTILRDNKFDAQAIVAVRDAVARYPDSFELWQVWATIPTANLSDVARAKAEMKRLDPFNPELK